MYLHLPKQRFLVNVDNLMELEILSEASKKTDNQTGYDIAC